MSESHAAGTDICIYICIYDQKINYPLKINIKMRKLKLQVQLSVDGFVAGPNGEMDWMAWNWDDELKNHVNELTDSIDCILLGRKMTDGFISYWTSVVADPGNPQYPFAKKMIDTPKIVFSKTLTKSAWNNTLLANGDIAEEVSKLKKQNGKDIIVYGGSTFVSNLIKQNLIDEYHLFINPAAIGKGLSIFGGLNEKLNLKPVDSKTYECGVVALLYIPVIAK
jgi:dihydrofolate reductase